MSFNVILNSSNAVGSNANTYNYSFIGGNFEVEEGVAVLKAKLDYNQNTFPQD
jgi:hypothetical protein